MRPESRKLGAFLGALLVVAACGGSTSSVSDPDSGGGGADGAASGDGAGSGGDAARVDASADVIVSDAPAEATACAACQPDFCGCGVCTAEQIVCTKTPKVCPLGCASACDLSKFTCGCEADRCVRTGPPAGAVVACYATADCPPGSCCKLPGGPLRGTCVAGNGC
jgi:hypothetical protein